MSETWTTIKVLNIVFINQIPNIINFTNGSVDLAVYKSKVSPGLMKRVDNDFQESNFVIIVFSFTCLQKAVLLNVHCWGQLEYSLTLVEHKD